MELARQRGLALPELIAALALAMIVSATTIPVVAGSLSRERALVGANYLLGTLKRAQLEAVRRGACVALRFAIAPDETRFQIFVDTNGNGVSSSDIEDGIDAPIGPEERLGDRARRVALRINQTVPDIAGAGTLLAGDDPLRIGRTSLLTFSPAGSATSGTLYVAAPEGPQLALRVMGASGRVRLLRFDGTGRWQP